jgi:uncharacterized protein YkwD
VLLRNLLVLLLLPASALADAGQGQPVCTPDAGLDRAAAELALHGGEPDAAALARALSQAGSDLVGVRARRAREGDAEHAAWLRAFMDAADAPVVCGEAAVEGGRLTLVAARAGSLDLLGAAGEVVRGSLSRGFGDAQLVVEDAHGELENIPVTAAALRAGIPVAADLPRPARIQLVASGPRGPRPVAERMLGAFPGQLPPQATEPQGAAGVPLTARLSQLRRGAGSPPLRENRVLQQVARNHAAGVCASRAQVAHQLEDGADPQQRLRAAGIVARRVGETVARGSSAPGAFAAFERSPSHRMTLLERGFTDVGIGEAQHEGKTCVVVLLAAWPRFVGGSGALGAGDRSAALGAGDRSAALGGGD